MNRRGAYVLPIGEQTPYHVVATRGGALEPRVLFGERRRVPQLQEAGHIGFGKPVAVVFEVLGLEGRERDARPVQYGSKHGRSSSLGECYIVDRLRQRGVDFPD